MTAGASLLVTAFILNIVVSVRAAEEVRLGAYLVVLLFLCLFLLIILFVVFPPLVSLLVFVLSFPFAFVIFDLLLFLHFLFVLPLYEPYFTIHFFFFLLRCYFSLVNYGSTKASIFQVTKTCIEMVL